MIVEELERDGTRYSVRAHGGSTRLYTNGVFHSQWNAARPFAGGVWDCLSLPALYREPASVRRVLVLGVGGGAVLRQLALLLPAMRATGVELDGVHLELARRHFGLDALDGRASFEIELVQADAVRWVADVDVDGDFDLIVDDLYGDAGGRPVRAVPLELDWVRTLVERLAPEGLYVANAVEPREAKRAVPVFADAGLRHGAHWSQAAWDNVITVCSREPLHSREWSRRLDASALGALARRAARGIVRQPLRGL